MLKIPTTLKKNFLSRNMQQGKSIHSWHAIFSPIAQNIWTSWKLKLPWAIFFYHNIKQRVHAMCAWQNNLSEQEYLHKHKSQTPLSNFLFITKQTKHTESAEQNNLQSNCSIFGQATIPTASSETFPGRHKTDKAHHACLTKKQSAIQLIMNIWTSSN